MSGASVFVFLLPVLMGILLAHLMWPTRRAEALLLKVFLGIGLGLGVSSLLYFLYLLGFAARRGFVFVQLVVCLALLGGVLLRERKQGGFSWPRWKVTRLQGLLLGAAGLVFVISLLSTASYLLRRKQGDWDAWMMYNRAARFIYRDQAHWLESFSPRMDPIFHPDYPLLLALNTASGWDLLGEETPHVSMIQSALFAVACAGLLFAALLVVRSPGQAALGLVVLWGTPMLVNEGARQMADLPLAFFILAAVVLVYLSANEVGFSLLPLAGLTAGLAAWTKNEGSVFVLAAGLSLWMAFLRRRPAHILLGYMLGLALPIAVVLAFKLFIAPASDVLSAGPTRALQQVLDVSRHEQILRSLGRTLFRFGGWQIGSLTIGIIPTLCAYFLLSRQGQRAALPPPQRSAYAAGVVMVLLQLLGDYGAYLISPYDLSWHLGYSVARLVLQVFPALVFLLLAASRSPEALFGEEAAMPRPDS